MRLKVDTLLQGGKYKIVRFINNGGFGCTYEAKHVMLHKRIAIKEFFVKDFCNRDELTGVISVAAQSKVALVNRLREKFIEEAISLSQMSYANIVQVTDVFEENGTAYYVMDYIDGLSLDEIIKSKTKLSEEESLIYIRQIAGALDYVHGMNRLHLDIKPGNIMVNKNGQAILIDFGVSKQYDSIDGENTSTLLGKTPGYAPIEQMGNSVQQFTPATDIYALGATLYKLLSGVTPPESTIIFEDGIPELDSSVSNETKLAVSRAMEFRRKDRPQSIKEFLAMLPTGVESRVDVEDETTCIVEGNEDSMTPTSNEETCFDYGLKTYVDLGLSVKWSAVNVGASAPWQIGKLIGWGDATGCEHRQDLDLYPNENPPMSISRSQYDVVTKYVGGSYRIPTEKEFDELIKECKFIRDSQNNVEGYRVVGKNGNSIFLPFTGYRHGEIIEDDSEVGNYWSGTLHQANKENAYYYLLTDNTITKRATRRHFGFAIRSVCSDC